MCAWCWPAKHLGDYEQAASHACSASVPKLCAQLPDLAQNYTHFLAQFAGSEAWAWPCCAPLRVSEERAACQGRRGLGSHQRPG